MGYAAIGKKVLNLGTKYGKHKVPRFIYHMTNKTNYESMLRDGFIKTSPDVTLGRGVFATELTNLFKRWRLNKSWGNDSLQEKLLSQIAKGSDDIVILKIPTAKLNQDLLRIRSQNTLFKFSSSEETQRIIENIGDELLNLPGEKINWLDKIFANFKKHLSMTKNSPRTKHLTEGAPVNESKLYTKRKQAIEYVYKDNIPITDAEKIGELNIATLRSSTEYDPTKPMRSIFTALLKGTPEVKGAELLNC